jgi:protein-S-isoprenylcysteine O-methyltransferase Ste14
LSTVRGVTASIEAAPSHEKARVMRTFYVVLVALLAVADTRWVDAAAAQALLFPLGVLLVGASVVGRIWCVAYHAGYKNVTILDVGPYSLSRNPMYFCNFLGALGAVLTTVTLSIPLLYVAVFAAYSRRVIRREERQLEVLHPEAFAAYRARTPAFVPKWSLLREPERYALNARRFRRAMLHSLPPIALLAAVGMLHALHLAGILPVLVRLY